MRAISECEDGPLNCVEVIKHAPVGLQPNHISVEYLFSSLRTKKDVKLFGPKLFEWFLVYGLTIDKNFLFGKYNHDGQLP